ncbi:MAG TPA: hypothetical protein VFO89_06220 [Thermoanaerobaculia bacterium]|nr:hypothetical protein [Thermoanaerobaculia bacterium]
MTVSPELARCTYCECWFAAAAADEVFFHATRGCRRNGSAAVARERDGTPPRRES